MSKKSKAKPVSPPPAAPVPAAAAASADRQMTEGKLALILFAVQGLLLAWAGLVNRLQLNTDGIAYLQLAKHYAAGHWDLAVSGYWGPLWSWLTVPWLKLGFAPLDAGRLTMGVSGLVFSVGTWRFLRSVFGLGTVTWLGTGVAMVASFFWSVQYLTPDLLLAGLLALALSEMVRPEWWQQRAVMVRAGAWWGLAYLAKAVAFPLAGLVTLLVAGLWWFTKQAPGRRAAQAMLVTWAIFAVVALPWITVLSIKYGGPTFSTSGKINHAIVGPKDVERWHSFGRTLQAPAPGRLTSWEDPSPKEYAYWSPFQSATYFHHQLHLVQTNFETVVALLTQTDWFWLGLLSLLGCAVITPPWRERLGQERWRWSALVLAVVAGIYLPVYVRVADDRYFYLAVPLLWSTAAGLVWWATAKSVQLNPWPRRLALGVVTVSFLFPAGTRALAALGGLENPPVMAAHILADRLQQAKIAGPVAGSASLVGERAGLYMAFLLDQPWYGDQPQLTAAALQASGARLVVLKRDDPLVAELAREKNFRDLEPVLFPQAEEASQFPLKVFEIIR